MVKVISTFIDAIRREGILIEDSKSSLLKNNVSALVIVLFYIHVVVVVVKVGFNLW